MNLRKFVWLFLTTMLIGGIGGVVSGLLIGWSELVKDSVSNFLVGSLMNVFFGTTISVVAQMGLFAYMTFNYMALSIFKNSSLWKSVQVFFIVFAFFDMVYLRYVTGSRGTAIWPYLLEPTILLLISIVFAYIKVRITNKSAWIPSVFFLFVVTAVEWIPGLKEQHFSSILSMFIPLMACNIWQVLNLHRVTRKEADPRAGSAQTS